MESQIKWAIIRNVICASSVIFMGWVIATVFLSLAGCTEYQTMQPGVFYKRDMKFAVEGLGNYQGVSVLPQRMNYKFTIEPKKDDPDLLIVRSCHREDTFEKNQSSFSLFKKNENKYEYFFEPVPNVEVGRVCPLKGDALHLENNNSVHSWFFIDFEAEADGYTLHAELVCNAHRTNINGVGVCQARRGLIQTIQFGEPIKWTIQKPDQCFPWIDKGNNRYEVEIGKGECLYHAYNRDKEKLRITTLGYEGINLREGY